DEPGEDSDDFGGGNSPAPATQQSDNADVGEVEVIIEKTVQVHGELSNYSLLRRLISSHQFRTQINKYIKKGADNVVRPLFCV
ncbi:hypothetical protein, partial [Bacillus velezensis]|uniref:hypothetical protein n=1 Tax=Bacillus velezensis TaxID=492670 RepID=UPI001A8C5809